MIPARGIIAPEARSDQWLMTPYDVRFGSKVDMTDMAEHDPDVRFVPKADMVLYTRIHG